MPNPFQEDAYRGAGRVRSLVKASRADEHPDGRYQSGLSTLSAVVKALEDSVVLVDAATVLLKLANHVPDQHVRPVFSRAVNSLRCFHDHDVGDDDVEHGYHNDGGSLCPRLTIRERDCQYEVKPE
jgi:hypothetical protein